MSDRSSPAPGTPTGAAPIPDEEEADADLPLTMAASVVLTGLPKDAKSALEGAGDMPRGFEKGVYFPFTIMWSFDFVSGLLSCYGLSIHL
jgi:hypothetical protein